MKMAIYRWINWEVMIGTCLIVAGAVLFLKDLNIF